MKSPDPKAEREALATLRMLREQLTVPDLSEEDQKTVAESWPQIGGLEPKKVPLGGSLTAAVFPVLDFGDLEARLVPLTLALRTFAHAIELGLPGAEHEIMALLEDCGFEEERADEILQRMMALAPEPEDEELN
jgi:hypothetical protein